MFKKKLLSKATTCLSQHPSLFRSDSPNHRHLMPRMIISFLRPRVNMFYTITSIFQSNTIIIAKGKFAPYKVRPSRVSTCFEVSPHFLLYHSHHSEYLKAVYEGNFVHYKDSVYGRKSTKKVKLTVHIRQPVYIIKWNRLAIQYRQKLPIWRITRLELTPSFELSGASTLIYMPFDL